MSAIAALDCGTNSTRLLVADEDGRTLEREMRITRLGEGVDRTGELQPAALERTFACLTEYAAIMARHDVTLARLVATSAARDARNGEEFLRVTATITGAEVHLLSGDREAELSYVGATADLESSDLTTMIIDIGGGSTELAARIDGVLHAFSMQLGCVRVSERAIGPGVVTDEGEGVARSMIESEIDRALSSQPEFRALRGRVRLVGLAGTVSTLAQLDARESVYDRSLVHHRVLTRHGVGAWRRTLAQMTPDERLALPGMVKGREDVLTAGLFVLEGVMDAFEVDELLTSESDILDGIIAWIREDRESA